MRFIHGFISHVLAESLWLWLISYRDHWVVWNRADTSCSCQCALGRGCCKRPLSTWGCRKPACRQKKLINPAPCATLQDSFNPKRSIFLEERPSNCEYLNLQMPGDKENTLRRCYIEEVFWICQLAQLICLFIGSTGHPSHSASTHLFGVVCCKSSLRIRYVQGDLKQRYTVAQYTSAQGT